MNIVANKVKGIRACLCHTVEFARLAKEHNDANVLVIAGRFIDTKTALDIVKAFLETEFSGEERHKTRIKKITDYENSRG
jgi:ribose 5-phosphate isomerase B